MAFFEQIGKKISNAGQSVAQQTKNFADVSQLNSAISEKEKKISRLFLNLGEMYYEIHKDDLESDHYEVIAEISRLYSEIEQDQEKIKKIKGVVKCPQCGADVLIDAAFCSSCGAKIGKNIVKEDHKESYRFCPVCHSVIDSDDSFCNHCGTKIENS